MFGSQRGNSLHASGPISRCCCGGGRPVSSRVWGGGTTFAIEKKESLRIRVLLVVEGLLKVCGLRGRV